MVRKGSAPLPNLQKHVSACSQLAVYADVLDNKLRNQVEDDTEKREDDELGDDQERPVACHHSPVDLVLGQETLLLGELPHDDRKQQLQDSGQKRRRHTDKGGEGPFGLIRPSIQEADVLRNGWQVG